MEILKRLGHCISYKIISGMETIQAVKAQLLASQRAVVPIVPLSEIGRVFNLC